MTIREQIIEIMQEKKYKPMIKEELAVQFDIPRSDLPSFYKVLEAMEKEGAIIKAKNDRYGLIDNEYLVAGTLQGNERGFGFLIPNDRTRNDIFIPAENLNGAMNGDKVIANITNRGEAGKKEEGEIIRILERANKTIVGTFEDKKKFWICGT